MPQYNTIGEIWPNYVHHYVYDSSAHSKIENLKQKVESLERRIIGLENMIRTLTEKQQVKRIW